jgi:glutamate--cysteine ligase
MLVRWPGRPTEPCPPGLPFATWTADGHPDFGWPTTDDLDYHLTTLFFEVRPRGFLELRSPDALPDSLRPALVALLAGALVEPHAREECLAALSGLRPQLPGLWRRAAAAGLADPVLADLARIAWGLALAGARRLPPGYLGREPLAAAERFVERYVLPGRTPGHELAELDREDAAAALAWASSGWSRVAAPRAAG